MRAYQTLDGDVLDAVVVSLYGECNDSILALFYALNPGLADYGALLPSGIRITLPDNKALEEARSPKVRSVSLWD